MNNDGASWLLRKQRGEEGPHILGESVEKDLPRGRERIVVGTAPGLWRSSLR